jgi:hypothetical protein
LPGRSGVTGILVSVTPDGAAPASNGRQRRPCRLLPCAAGFVQNPSSECPTTRLQSGTKHYAVREDLTAGSPVTFRMAPQPARMLRCQESVQTESVYTFSPNHRHNRR